MPVDAEEVLEAKATLDRWQARRAELPRHLREAAVRLADLGPEAIVVEVRRGGEISVEATPALRALIASLRALEP